MVRKFGPASELALVDVDGQTVVIAFDTKPNPKGITYDVTITGLESGKVVAHRTLAADADGLIDAIDMQILYWTDGYTRLVASNSTLLRR